VLGLLEAAIVVELAGGDQGHMAFAVPCEHLFPPGLRDVVRKLGQTRARRGSDLRSSTTFGAPGML